MSVDIVGTLEILIKLGIEIKTRLESLNQAAEDLQLLTTNLVLLVKIFEDPVNQALVKTNVVEFVYILDVLQSIARSCTECARALDVDIAGVTAATKKPESRRTRFLKRLWTFNKIPDLLAEIQRRAEQLQQIYNVVCTVIVQDVRVQQVRTNASETIDSICTTKEIVSQESSVDPVYTTQFASIDKIVENLIKECSSLRQKLKDATLVPDRSTVRDFEIQNAEAVSFWRDRFQNTELNASTLRYEAIYVSWARFVHIIENSIDLKQVPTGVLTIGDIDVARRQGSRYTIDYFDKRSLSNVRPLWLPTLRDALDPLHRGYVKPHDYFRFLQDSSLSVALRRLVMESAGYGFIVECERAPGDLALVAEIESPPDHVGWMTAQIVAVPTSSELGIVTEREVAASSREFVFDSFNNATQDIFIYVRYLQTGQIERKSLYTQVRPLGGIFVGTVLSVRRELESGNQAWSHDLLVSEFKACCGGRYLITAGVGSTAVVFSTRPCRIDPSAAVNSKSSTDFGGQDTSFALLGPSKFFSRSPKVGEKIQIEHEGLWYDSRVTVVDEDEIEYENWDEPHDRVATYTTEDEQNSEEEDYAGSFFFPEEQLAQLGKGKRRLWQPWRRDISKYDVRPYRRLHIGDSIEAPVMYPDFRDHYHTVEESQLYLPARIVDVQGDQYVVEFSPALSVHRWWPGRKAKDEEIHLAPGSEIKVKNPFDFNRVTLNMDLVRPLSIGPRPVLGIQTMRPPGWSAFQGVHLSNLEDLLEQSLWSNDGRSSGRTDS